MTIPIFSLLHATRRPEKAATAMRMWLDRAGITTGIEYIFAVDRADGGIDPLIRALGVQPGLPVSFVECGTTGSAKAWDAAYRRSRGSVLIQVSDDFECPHEWAPELLLRLNLASARGVDAPAVVAVSDGFRTDRLTTIAIATRAYCALEGCFISRAYDSVFSDGEFCLRAYLADAKGWATVIEARDMVFRHRHAWADPVNVPWDHVYEESNSAQRYDEGGRIFRERNPDWFKARMSDGSRIVNWV